MRTGAGGRGVYASRSSNRGRLPTFVAATLLASGVAFGQGTPENRAPKVEGRPQGGAIESPEALEALREMAKKPPDRPEVVEAAREKRLAREMLTPRYQRAEAVFKDQCASCHGDRGFGDGPWHTLFHPYPANLTLVRDAPAMLRSVVIKGVPGTMMPAHPEMSSATIDDIFHYVSLQPDDATSQYSFPWDLGAEIDKITPAEGRVVFLTACRGCHGNDGTGNGVLAKSDYVWPKPANLTARSSNVERLYHIITYGRLGTFMSGWLAALPTSSRWAAARYVESIFREDARAQIDAPRSEPPTRVNPYSRNDREVAKAGGDRLELWCAQCHGSHGRGTFQAPRLIDRAWLLGGGTDTAVFTVLNEGVPGTLMPSFAQLGEDERWRIITFIRSMGGLPLPGMRDRDADLPMVRR